MTDEEFTAFCAEHPDLNFEMTAEGELIVIDPENRSFEIYRPDGGLGSHTGAKEIEGEEPVAGFVLDLTHVWDPLADKLVSCRS